MRLVALPHAGGGASAYLPWFAQLRTRAPASCEFLAVQLPGREHRVREAAPSSWPTLIEELTAALAALPPMPTALLGHSLGALSAYELARRAGPALRVAHLVVSGAGAPDLPPVLPPIAHLPRADFLEQIASLGGVPPEVLAHEEILDLIQPVLRADVRLREAYRHEPGPKVRCPLTVLGGRDDPLTTPTSLEAWRQHGGGGVTVRTVAGDHFFLHRSQEVVVHVTGILRSLVAR